MTALTTRHVEYFDTLYVLQSGGALSRSMLEKSSLPTREDWSGDKPEQARKITENPFSDDQDSSPQIRNMSVPAQTTTGTGLDLYKYFFAKMGLGSISMVFAASATFVFCFKFPMSG
jgi:hypothetical protein